MSGQDWLEKDFYASLGVPKDADAAAVKKAYRKLARTHHPDHNPGDAAAEARFKEIGEAYAVLSDAEKRQQYDSLRAMAGGGPRFASGPGGGGAGGFEDLFGGMFGGAAPGAGSRGGTRSSAGAGAGAGGPDLEDLLAQFGMGGGSTRGAPAGFGAQQGGDITTSARLPFRQAVEGATVTLTLQRSGSMNVRIPAGVKDGQKIRLRGRGQPGLGGGQAGDLVVTVGVDPHPVFGLSGPNLTITVPVSFTEAVAGATISVPTLEGGSVRLKVPAGTSSGARLRVKGKGVPAKGGAGDLIVTVQVAVPRNLSDKARAALEEFAAATASEDPRVGLADAARS